MMMEVVGGGSKLFNTRCVSSHSVYKIRVNGPPSFFHSPAIFDLMCVFVVVVGPVSLLLLDAFSYSSFSFFSVEDLEGSEKVARVAVLVGVSDELGVELLVAVEGDAALLAVVVLRYQKERPEF